MRIHLLLLVCAGAACAWPEEKLEAVPSECIQNAEGWGKQLGNPEPEVREPAQKALLELLGKKNTKSWVLFWEEWVRQQKVKFAENDEIISRLSKVPLGKIFTIRDAIQVWTLPAYQTDHGQWELHGKVTLCRSGNTYMEFPIQHGKVEGVVICRDPKGDSTHWTCQYSKDEKNGAYRAFHEGTTKIREQGNYVHGKQDGEWTCFGTDGKELGRYSMKKGTGTKRVWHTNGKLWREEAHMNGFLWGRYRLWDEAGKLRVEGQFLNLAYVENRDKPDGRWIIKDDKILMDFHFEAGAPVEGYVLAPIPGQLELQRLDFKEGHAVSKKAWQAAFEAGLRVPFPAHWVYEGEAKDGRFEDSSFSGNYVRDDYRGEDYQDADYFCTNSIGDFLRALLKATLDKEARVANP